MWMRAPMPVTNRHIVMLSGSARKPIPTLKLPAGIHVKSVWVRVRSCSDLPSRSMNTATLARKEPATAAVASQPALGSPSLRPATSWTRKPARGSAGMSQMTLSTSAPQHRDVVGGRARAPAHDGDDDAEADHDLGRCHHQDEEDRHLPADVVERLREADERDVDGVEHELDAHEHDDGVLADQQAGGTDGEQRRGHDDVGGLAHAVTSSAATDSSSGSSSPDSPSCISATTSARSSSPSSSSHSSSSSGGSSSRSSTSPSGLRASTTAPTTATVRRMPVISNAQMYLVKSTRPSWSTSSSGLSLPFTECLPVTVVVVARAPTAASTAMAAAETSASGRRQSFRSRPHTTSK